MFTRSMTFVATSVLPPPVGIFRQNAGSGSPSPFRREMYVRPGTVFDQARCTQS